MLDDERIDWIANVHCHGGIAYPVNVKAAIKLALMESEDRMYKVGYSAKQRYDEMMLGHDEPSALERLRFFCSLSMSAQDWFDVEPFFDVISVPAIHAQPLTDAELRKIYTTGYEIFAGPKQFQHAVNHTDYHTAGLRAIERYVSGQTGGDL